MKPKPPPYPKIGNPIFGPAVGSDPESLGSTGVEGSRTKKRDGLAVGGPWGGSGSFRIAEILYLNGPSTKVMGTPDFAKYVCVFFVCFCIWILSPGQNMEQFSSSKQELPNCKHNNKHKQYNKNNSIKQPGTLEDAICLHHIGMSS